MGGLSFDNVVMNDGYIEPSPAYNASEWSDVPCLQSLLDCQITGKDGEPFIEILPFENTDASSIHFEASDELVEEN